MERAFVWGRLRLRLTIHRFEGLKGLSIAALGKAQGTESALRKRALKGRPKDFHPGRLAWALIERRFAAQNLEIPELRPQAWALVGRPTG